MSGRDASLQKVLNFLTIHHQSFYAAARFAVATDHPVPCDTRAWSQILISTLTGIKGIARKKGADFADGSDVKGANVWLAIDTPRFNGCLKAGRKGVQGCMGTLNDMPHLFFALWDYASPEMATARTPEVRKHKRCRVWVVRPKEDTIFRAICETWYNQRAEGTIKSDNFQLHPPRNQDSNVIRNTCGNLIYPLLFRADWTGAKYVAVTHAPELLKSGTCENATQP